MACRMLSSVLLTCFTFSCFNKGNAGPLKGFGLPFNSLSSTGEEKPLDNKLYCMTMYEPIGNCLPPKKFRTFDGTCNNLGHKDFGAAPNRLQRLIQAKYFDSAGLNDPVGYPNQPSAPQVPSSYEVAEKFIIGQPASHRSSRNKFSHLVMQWGQWLDHDLSHSIPISKGSDECQKNSCSLKPPCYNMQRPGNKTCLPFPRSMAACPLKSGNKSIKREQINDNTAFIDGSQIYGSTENKANKLRIADDDIQIWCEETHAKTIVNEYYTIGITVGSLKFTGTVRREILPFHEKVDDLKAPENFCLERGGCFLAGDDRVNEQPALASMHTLFLREHNRIVREFGSINSHWTGDRKYTETRKIIGAILQKITYDDYLPIIIGSNTISKYKGYNNTVNPGILNSFSTAAYRFGHSMIRQDFDLLNANFDPIADPLPLRQMFFNNSFVTNHGIEPLLLGLLGNASEIVDRKLASDLLNNLFEGPMLPGLNLAALNIQRGRDHGLPGYNAFRRVCGLSHAKTFDDTKKEIRDPKVRKTLRKLYNDDPEIADLWPAGLAEDPVNGGKVGPTFQCIIKIQFQRLRDGDRFFFEREEVFTSDQLAEIQRASVSRIFCDNLYEVVSIQKNAFFAGSSSGGRVNCGDLPKIDLKKWKENRTTQ